jgi:class 3 adenylate cyclase/ferritin-like metal-binding protein YciE
MYTDALILLNIFHVNTGNGMIQKINDYQIRNLVKYIDKTLLLENNALERLPTRINETSIDDIKQRMIQHLKHTFNQKNRLEQIIFDFKKSYDFLDLNTTQIPVVSNTKNTKENSFQTSAKPSNTKSENLIDDITTFPEQAEFAKIKQDYIIEYDELIAYETLIQMAEMTEFEDKEAVMILLNEGKQEEELMVYWFQLHAPIILDNLWPKMINNAMKRSQAFLTNHKNSKMGLIILYADLVGSTKMSMTLPIKDLVLLIRAFTHELSNVIERYHGYVLKYSGDAVISFFPYIDEDTKYNSCTRAIECAKSIINDAIKKEINSILSEKYNYPELKVKIGIDEGENAIIQYGYEKNSPIDILGYCMNIVSKITSLTVPNGISLGENAFNLLDEKAQTDFLMLSMPENNWKYINPDTNTPYTIYRSIFVDSLQ